MGQLRKGVGIIVRNADNLLWMGKRVGDKQNYWQFPQGGIDSDEDVSTAALRELYEETGIHTVRLEALSQQTYSYLFPQSIQETAYNGKYIGQEMQWLLFQFEGHHDEIDLHKTLHPEFEAWQWAPPAFAEDHVIAFKREVYRQVLKEFRLY